MNYYKMPANGFMVTVGNTAKTIEQLVQSAIGGQWEVPKGINMAHFQVQVGSVRYCPDGNTPTDSAGLLYVEESEVNPIMGNIREAKFIRSGDTDATMALFIGFN